MIFPIQKIFYAIALILVSSSLIFSQDLRKQAEESLLSTVSYLLSTTDKDSKAREKACLANSLAKINKFTEMKKLLSLL